MSDSKRVLVSVDVETTGLSPATGNMISIGAASLWLDDYDRIDTFEINLQDLIPGVHDQDTLEWWQTSDTMRERWKEATSNKVPAEQAMQEFNAWLLPLEATPVFVAWPASFDFAWVDFYYKSLKMENPFGYKPVDMASFAAGMMGDPFEVIYSRSKGESHFPPEFQPKAEKEHNALSDALAQREGFIAMLEHSKLLILGE